MTRLALVGTGYGLAYLDALSALPGVALVALGSRGSDRSREVARALELPLYTSMGELLEAARPDAVVVAVPPEAAVEVARPLLARGCGVLCEFPIDGADAEALVRAARDGGAYVAVNAHFSHLRAPAAFARRCLREGAPAVVDVVCHERTLYACLDLVRRAFGHAFAPERAVGGVVVGRVGEAPAAVRVTPLLSDVDDGSDVFFGMRVSAGFSAPGRSVTLVDVLGPVLASRTSLVDVRRVLDATPPRRVAAERARANALVLRRFLRACGTRPARRPPADFVEVARAYSATVAMLQGA